MNYMYHRVPTGMIGDVLYPLNVLRSRHPSAYDEGVRKYLPSNDDQNPYLLAFTDRNRLDRRYMLDYRIERLDCLWNDVLHSSAVHPQKLMRAWCGAGFRADVLRMYAIPIDRLDPDKLLIWEFRSFGGDMPDDEQKEYRPEQYQTYAEVSEQAHARLREFAQQGVFWPYFHIPHVMYYGSISVADCEIVTAVPPQMEPRHVQSTIATLGPGDAVVIVDVQVDFCPGGALPVAGGHDIVPVLNRWIEAAVEAGAAVVASRDWHPHEHVSFTTEGGPWPPHCMQDTDGARFHPDLRLPDTTIVVTKGTRFDREQYSAFQGTGLATELRRRGVRRLWIGGLAQDVCVRATALDAVREGFAVELLVAATRPVSPEGGREALAAMAAGGVGVPAARS